MSWQRRPCGRSRPKTMRITINGALAAGVHSKDVILAIIGKIGAGGAGGHAIEYAGPAIRAMSIEQRLTICNMSIEAAARCGMVAPDDTTFEYLHGRPFAPDGSGLGRRACAIGARCRAKPDARFDREVELDGAPIEPMVTWGTSPEDTLPISGYVPDPAAQSDAARREMVANALAVYGPGAGHGSRRRPHRSGLHRLLHQQPARGPARRGRGAERSESRRSSDGRAGIHRREARRGSGRDRH